MDLAAVLAQLNDLPQTFKPPGNPWYQLLINALAEGDSLYTQGADAEQDQVANFAGAVDGWIDFWGLLFGIPRNPNEGNIPYAVRITETVLAWVGTVPAIQVWINLFAPGGSVAENASGLGYVITLPGSMSFAQAQAFVTSLGRIRPIGVPFSVKSNTIGLFLDTEGFLGVGVTVGSFLIGTASPLNLGLNATTLSSQPLIPTLLMTDPILNPGLAA